MMQKHIADRVLKSIKTAVLKAMCDRLAKHIRATKYELAPGDRLDVEYSLKLTYGCYVEPDGSLNEKVNISWR